MITGGLGVLFTPIGTILFLKGRRTARRRA